jgi:hypothetical protein
MVQEARSFDGTSLRRVFLAVFGAEAARAFRDVLATIP